MQQMQGNKTIRIIIVDDHPWVRLGLVKLLEHEADFFICGEAEDAVGAMDVIGTSRPDIVLVDISLKGDVDGIELTRWIKRDYPEIPVLILSMHAESEYAALALAAGASGYIVKSEATDFLPEALRNLFRSES